MNYYRGIRYTSVSREPSSSVGGVYRGVKHSAIQRETQAPVQGLCYRGTEH